MTIALRRNPNALDLTDRSVQIARVRMTTAREKLIESATRIMLAKGFAATSVDEICAGAGASKGSFYHFFDSKETLGLAALNAVFTRMLQRLRNGPHADIEDPVGQAFAFLDHVDAVAEELWGDGCLVGSFAMDVAESSPAVRTEVSRLFSDLKAGLAEWFEPLCTARGRFDPGCGAELAEHFVEILQGSIVLAKAHDDWSYVMRALQRFRRHVSAVADAG